MRKTREMLRLRCKMNLSIRQTARSVNVPRSTVTDYYRRFSRSGLSIDKLLKLDDKAIEAVLFPEHRFANSAKRPLPDMSAVHLEMKDRRRTKVTLSLLWQEYREIYPDGYGYTQFCEYYRRYRQKLNPSMRQIYLGGDKLFVDYSGLTVRIYDSKTNETSKAQIFVAVLGASGLTFVYASPSQNMENFIRSHILAFEFFGGSPRILVPDNLKSAVIKHSRNEIIINESYADMACHYGAAVEPARPRKPKDKPKVEQGVQGIERWLLARLRNHKFFSVDELNQALTPLLDRYNAKVVKHLDASRNELFERLDKPYLSPLPGSRYIYREFKLCRVHSDYHIQLEKCFYSVPYNLTGEEVDVRYNARSVEIYHHNTLVAGHRRLHHIGDAATLYEHMPSNHQYVREKMNSQRLKNWAERIGENSLQFTQTVLNREKPDSNAYRHIAAVLSMEKIYGTSELETVLSFALAKHILATRSIRSILNKKLYLTQDADNTANVVPILHNNHANLRGKQNYR